MASKSDPKATGVLSHDAAREEHAYALGIQAVLWGYPLAEYLNTNYVATKSGASFLNYFRRFDALKTAADRYVVTPNNVSIDAYGAADLRKEPLVLSVPSLMKPRWYLVQVGDMFDELAYEVGGYKGAETGLFLVTGPDHAGPVPANMRQLKVRTHFAVIALRVFVQGDGDLPAALTVQRGFHMLPLSVFQAHGLKYPVPKTDPGPLQFVASAPEALRKFDQIGAGMKMFLSLNEDHANPLVTSFRPIGLSVANGFDWNALDDPTRRGLARAAIAAEQIIEDAYLYSAEVVDGWRYTMSGGRAGNDLPVRAALVKYVLGANLAEQALYPNTRVDDAGQPLSGTNRYVLHFDKATVPPVSFFWNLSMYDDKALFIENPQKRYSIGSTTDGLKADADGSIDIYIQHDDPGADKQSNWLPAPADGFNLTMRLYGAQPNILDGSYRLPAVRKVS